MLIYFKKINAHSFKDLGFLAVALSSFCTNSWDSMFDFFCDMGIVLITNVSLF